MQEEWRTLEPCGFSDYSISDVGRVRNDRTNRIMSMSLNGHGILKVGMTNDNRARLTVSISSLMAEIFLPPSDNPNDNALINIDGDRTNNCVDNLARRPRWFAVRYHKQFSDPRWGYEPFRVLDSNGRIYESLEEVVLTHGLLRMDALLSVLNGTPVYPTGLVFKQYS